MNTFIQSSPTLDSFWRAIILFGKNTASYKFALAKSLIDLSTGGKNFFTLEELARPFSNHILDHLKKAERQGTSPSSQFLRANKDYLEGRITQTQLIEQTVRLGFVNVIDAFHIVNQNEIPKRFFIDERKTKNGISLTDEFFALKDTFQANNLPFEVEARWRLVETAWSMRLSPRHLVVRFDDADGMLFLPAGYNRRINITSSIDALNGYQKGKCFYCFSDISIDEKTGRTVDVDHFFPHVLKNLTPINAMTNIDGIWNLVLSCQECNRGPKGKFARVPEVRYLDRLNKRNNFLIESHHPLRETLIAQTGNTEKDRIDFLRRMDNLSIQILIHRWRPEHEHQPAF